MKVFCIGFNKTGTHTFQHILQQYGLKTMHNTIWQKWTEDKNVSLLNQYQAYTDGQKKDFVWLDKTFPGSKFILNTRPLDNWLLSRWGHIRRNQSNKAYKGDWLNNSPEIVSKWITTRELYHQSILDYFKNKSQDFVVLDLETMDKKEIKNKLDNLFKKFSPVTIPKSLHIRIINPTNKHSKNLGRKDIEKAFHIYQLPLSKWKNNLVLNK